jgi:hypothetical protein
VSIFFPASLSVGIPPFSLNPVLLRPLGEPMPVCHSGPLRLRPLRPEIAPGKTLTRGRNGLFLAQGTGHGGLENRRQEAQESR